MFRRGAHMEDEQAKRRERKEFVEAGEELSKTFIHRHRQVRHRDSEEQLGRNIQRAGRYVNPANHRHANHQHIEGDMGNLTDHLFPDRHADRCWRGAVSNAPEQAEDRQDQYNKSEALVELEGIELEVFREALMRHQPSADEIAQNEKRNHPVEEAGNAIISRSVCVHVTCPICVCRDMAASTHITSRHRVTPCEMISL